MEIRVLGRTGIRVSAVAMGCEGFEGKSGEECSAMVRTAMACGIRFFDMYTPNPTVRANVGRALAEYGREQFVIQGHLCTDWRDGQYTRTREIGAVRRSFERLLSDMQLSFVEIGMIHYCDETRELEEILAGDILRYAKELKEQGKIRCIGLSTHNPDVVLRAVKSGEIDVIMMSVNPAYDMLPPSEDVDILFAGETYDRVYAGIDPKREEMYRQCETAGVALTVMKPFAGGLLLDGAQSPFGKALTPAQCIRYCLDRPAVAAVMGGMKNEEEIRAAAAVCEADAAALDYSAVLAGAPRAAFDGHCMYCGHCAPCAVKIEIAKVNRYLDLGTIQGRVPETVQEHYDRLSHHAGECIGCGACVRRCPFGVDIPARMRQAARLFGK